MLFKSLLAASLETLKIQGHLSLAILLKKFCLLCDIGHLKLHRLINSQLFKQWLTFLLVLTSIKIGLSSKVYVWTLGMMVFEIADGESSL